LQGLRQHHDLSWWEDSDEKRKAGVFIPAGETHKHKARAVTEVVLLVLVEEV
jgi:hypothetical protein